MLFVIIILLCLLSTPVFSADMFAPSLFLNHGGGPYPVLGEPDNLEIANFLKNVSNIVNLKSLKAIIVVTAHREEDVVTISSAEHHNLLYDYYNFPAESYKFKYGARGDPDLARKIHEAFEKEAITSLLDEERGWDHGVFIPMMLINPKADIPIVQVSILKNQDAKQHLDIGKVLSQFRKEGVAVFGSGMSYHNMKEFKKVHKDNLEHDSVVNNIFDKFLTDICTSNSSNREDVLKWTEVPQGLESHPLGDADHLMPLIVNIGAAGQNTGRKVFESVFLKKFKLSGFIWDN